MNINDFISNLPLQAISHWGYLVILLSAWLESTPVGVIIPANLIVIFAGFLVKIKVLHFFSTVFAACLGAILGDWTNYYLGKKFGLDLIKKYDKFFSSKNYLITKTQELIKTHPGKALIIGRFNPVTRSFAAFMAGTTSLKLKKFIVFSVVGGICWGVVAVLIGYLFGSSYEIGAKYLGNVTFVAFTIIILAIYLYRFINRNKKIFTRQHLAIIAANFLSLYIFFKMIEDVIRREGIIYLDMVTSNTIHFFWHPLMYKIMLIATIFLSPEFLLGAAIFILLYFLYKRELLRFWLFALILSAGALFNDLMKFTMHRPRPDLSLIKELGFSFPSAHAAIAMIFFGALIYLYKDRIANDINRWLFNIVSMALIALAGFTRIYLNVHYLSDVIGGYALGLFCLTLVILIFEYFSNNKNSEIKQ